MGLNGVYSETCYLYVCDCNSTFPISGGLSHWVQLSVKDQGETQFVLVDKSSCRYKVSIFKRGISFDTLIAVVVSKHIIAQWHREG